MDKRFVTVLLVTCVALSLAVVGCKGKAEKMEEPVTMDTTMMTPGSEPQGMPITEPAQTVATETIPPTAAPAVIQPVAPAQPAPASDRNKDIQKALKAAGFYTGSIDGKIGPRTKKAIEEFQASKGLKVDGKVGPKTWAELEKYLFQQ